MIIDQWIGTFVGLGLIPHFRKNADLPTGNTVAMVFLPNRPGEFEFTCQMRLWIP